MVSNRTEEFPPDEPGTLGVVFNEQSRRIFVGPINETLDGLSEEIRDVTSSAAVAVADYVFARGGLVQVHLDADSAYRVEVVKVGRTHGGHPIAIHPDGLIVGMADE